MLIKCRVTVASALTVLLEAWTSITSTRVGFKIGRFGAEKASMASKSVGPSYLRRNMHTWSAVPGSRQCAGAGGRDQAERGPPVLKVETFSPLKALTGTKRMFDALKPISTSIAIAPRISSYLSSATIRDDEEHAMVGFQLTSLRSMAGWTDLICSRQRPIE